LARPESDSKPTGFDRRIWPAALIVGMLIVILMNIAFIWVAVSGEDQVVDTYQTEPR
jgi:hypothetical protein